MEVFNSFFYTLSRSNTGYVSGKEKERVNIYYEKVWKGSCKVQSADPHFIHRTFGSLSNRLL